MNSGTRTVAPVLTVAGLSELVEAVSPLMPGSVMFWLVAYWFSKDRREFGREDGLLLRVEHHLDDLAVGHQVVVGDERLVDVDLLEGLGVHEVRSEVVLVGELVGTALHADELHLRTCGEGVVEHAAVFQILELRAHESGTFAGLDVLEIDDLERLALQLDASTDFDISGCCHKNIVFVYVIDR